MTRLLALLALIVSACWSVVAEETPDASPEDAGEMDELISMAIEPRAPWFEARSDTLYLYTSNIQLLPDVPALPAHSDSLLFQNFELRAHPPLIPNVTTELFLQQQLVRYAKFDDN